MRDPFPAPPTGFSTRAIIPVAKFLGLSTLPLHIHEVLAAYIGYNFLCGVVAPALSEKFTPNTYFKLSKKTRIDWDVRVVSLIQSIFISICALTIMSMDKTRRDAMSWQERIWGYDGASGMVQGFAAGYFLWDVQVSVMYLPIMGLGSLFHAISALLVTSLGFRPFANYYGLHFILYEMSTPFLNIHWFLDKLDMTGSTLQLVNGIILITTFGCSRLLWGTYQSVLIYRDIWTAWNYIDMKGGDAVHITNPTGSTSSEAAIMASWLALLYLGSNTILCVLNFYWFGLMIQSVRKRFGPAKKADAKTAVKDKKSN